MGVSIGGAVLPCLITSCMNKPLEPVDSSNDSLSKTIEFNVSTEQALSAAGGAVKKQFKEINLNGKPVIITRQDEQNFKVFSTVCTHLGCEINLPVSPGENFKCTQPCGHGAIFSFSDGEVIRGPAEDPLQSFRTSFDYSTNILKITT